MIRTTTLLTIAILSFGRAAVAQPAAPAQAGPATTIASRTGGLERHDGYLPFYVDLQRSRVLIEVTNPGSDVLYFVQVAKGIGNVDLGIDRGAGGASKVIAFERQG